MQTLSEIKELLQGFGLVPQKRFGQNFLIDQNLLRKIVELAQVKSDQTVLEVGPGTGSLTEELLERASKVVAVEIDRGFHRLLSERLAGRTNLVLIHDDVLAGKHALSPTVIAAIGPQAVLVSNLPYNIATPLVAQCLISSWASVAGRNAPASFAEACFPASRGGPAPSRFESMTFTVQQEVADRMVAPCDSAAYGPVSVIVSLLGHMQFGPVVPNTAFWPKPQVTSRAVRIDFDAQQALELRDAAALKALLWTLFTQRRKQVASAVRRKNSPFEPESFLEALAAAGIERSARAEQVSPQQFLIAANSLAGKTKSAPGIPEGL